MQAVYIVGAGATPVGEHYGRGMADLASTALRQALGPIDPQRINALFVGNALGGELASQHHLGAVLAGQLGLNNIPALRIEAAGASGAAALHQAVQAIAGGIYDLVAVLGVEKLTDCLEGAIEAALALATDSDHEAVHGATLTAQWALLMRRYMHVYGYQADDFAPFPINAHANAASNPQALYRFAINADKYRKAQQVCSPLNMLDCSTLADGAAALILAREGLARELGTPLIRISGSALATAPAALYARPDPLWLEAAAVSAQRALQQARQSIHEVQVFELTDPHAITAVLALEALGCAERGQGVRLGLEGVITTRGSHPLATGGGYKARGDAAGATGIYQIYELLRQLRGEAGAAQVPGARIALAQSLGGLGATAVTHILATE